MKSPATALRFLLAGAVLGWPLSGAGQDLSEAFRQAQDAVNQMRQNTGSYNSSSNYDSGAADRAARREEAAAEARAEKVRVDRVNSLKDQAEAAGKRGDAQEALRLARLSLSEAKSPKFRAMMEDWIKSLNTYIAKDDARRSALSTIESGNAAFQRKDYRETVALYRRALAIDPGIFSTESRNFLSDLEAYVKREDDSLAAAKVREANEARQRPAVTKLVAEARALIEEHPADALAKLDAALKLLPGDSETVKAWWWATAVLNLQQQKFEDAAKAIQTAGENSLDPALVTRWQERISAERQRQGGTVQAAYADLQLRLTPFQNTNTSAGPSTGLAFIGAGTVIKAGDQLMSAAATARNAGDLTVNYDVGGAAYAGSLPVVVASTSFALSERVRNDPRMIEATKELDTLQARRTQLDTEREELVKERNTAAGTARMAELTVKLEEKNRAYQNNLAAVAVQEQKVQRTKRTIDAEVEQPSTAKPAVTTTP